MTAQRAPMANCQTLLATHRSMTTCCLLSGAYEDLCDLVVHSLRTHALGWLETAPCCLHQGQPIKLMPDYT